MTDAGQKRNAWLAALACAAAVVACLVPVIAYALAPEPPTSLQVTAGSAKPVIATLRWTASPDAGTVGYNVYAAVEATGPYHLVASTTESTASFADGISGIAYYFRVVAVGGDGAESSYISASPVSATWSDSPHVTATSTSSMCANCHSVHDAETDLLYRWEIGASKPQAVCATCHDGRNTLAANITSGTRDSFALNSGHSMEPSSPTHAASPRGCETCHELHGSSDRARRLPARKVNGKSVASAGPELCLACHTDNVDWYGTGYPSTSAPTRDATGYPVAGTWPGPDVYASSTNAHRLMPETTRSPSPGEPIRRAEGDCLYCHAAHRGRNVYDGLLATFVTPTPSSLASDQAKGTYAALCFACHGGTQPTGFSTPTVDIKQFAIAGSSSAGHRVKTAGGMLPAGAPLPCYECHNPHGSARGNESLISDALGTGLETSSAAGVRRFCFACHTTADTARGWDSVATTFTAVSSTETVVGLRRDGDTSGTVNALRLPIGLVGHAEADTASCYACHGDTYTAGSNNVHNPSEGNFDVGTHTGAPLAQIISIGGNSYTPLCTDCHNPELNAEHGKATSSSAAASCAACHPTPRDTLAPWDKTTCAQGGCHTPVSSAPMHSNVEAVHVALPVNADCTNGTACHGGDLATIHSTATTTVASPGAVSPSGGVRVRSLAALRSTAATTTTFVGCQVCHGEGVPATQNCIECHVGFSHFTDPQMTIEAGVHTAAPAAQTVTISGQSFGPVDCSDCHAQLVISSSPEHQTGEPCATCHPTPKDTLAPAWDKSCTQGSCHTPTSTAPMHASIDASHAPVAGQTCYNSGCHPTSGTDSLAQTHRNASAILGGSTRASCQVCHWNGTPASGACDSCHPDRVDGTHATAAGVHAFTSGADAVPAGDAGCTNSGSGCHGAEALYDNFADYHPVTGCTGGTCHTSPSKAGYAGNGDCQTCHDGSFSGAPARATLAVDHYNETTHTATGLSATVSAGGTASAACTICHDPNPASGPKGLAAQHTNITPAAGSPYGPTVACVECHNDTRAGGNAEMLAGWTNDACSDCHSISSSAPQHGATAPVAATTSPQGCGSSGTSCHTTYDVHALHKDATGGCTLAGCHDASLQAAKPALGSCGTGGACHTDKADGNHGAAATHTFSAASDYSNATVTGCTNSGAGCHASETTYGSFADYHPATGCTSGACHTSPSKAGYTGDHECVSCHNGNYTGAPDVVSIAAASPDGHYNETTHTASGMTGTVKGSVAGTVSAACSDCHDPSAAAGMGALYSQHQGLPAPYGATTCADCHNSNLAVTAVVTTSWATRQCDACHNVGAMPAAAQHGSTAPAVTGSSTVACADAGCHDTWNLHDLHGGRSGGTVNTCALSGCHDYATQGTKPTTVTCGVDGACHTDKVDGSHGAIATHLFTTGSDAVLAGDAGCTNSGSGCHGTDPLRDNFSTYHPTSGCTAGTCHTSPSKPGYAGNGDCQTCHDGSFSGAPARATLAVDHYNETTHTATGLSATVSAGGTASAACTICHDPNPASGPKGLAAQHTNITPAAGSPYGPTVACVECHNDTRAGGNAEMLAGWTNDACSDCHSISSSAPQHGATAPVAATTSPQGCGSSGTSCHTTYDVHALHKDATGGCTLAGCHDASLQAAKPALGSCGTGGACHTDKADGNHGAAATHTFSAASDYSNATVTGCTNSGAGCHASETTYGSFADYHPATGCTSGACHTSPSKATYTGDHECVSCHNGNYTGAPDVVSIAAASPDGHYNETTHTASGMAGTVKGSAAGTVSAACSDCHDPNAASGMGALYNQHQGLPAPYTAMTCADCHNNNLAVTTVVTTNWATRQCDACHNVGAMPTAAQHGSTAPAVTGSSTVACADAGCHDTWNLHELHGGRSGGTVSTCALSGCHDYATQGTKPTTVTCGVDGACHTDKVDGSHGATVAHAFTAASDYNNATVTGCTNSGVGCHNTETTYESFAAYHPASGCLSGACHTSPSKATYTGNHECVSCHDGTFVNAPKTEPLHAPAGVGHYGETTHTASGLATAVTAGGTASATCNDCHNATNLGNSDVRQLYNQHQGLPGPYVDTTCADCHNKNVQVTAVVTSQWPTKQCDACHNSVVLPMQEQHGTTAPAIAPTAVGTYQSMACNAAGCHAQGDIHAIHKDAASCALAGCHDYNLQAKLPDGASCGVGNVCHDTAEPHNASLLTSAHNATSEPMAQPGVNTTTTVTTTTVDNQTFATATWPTGWTRSTATYVVLTNAAGRNHGTYAAQNYATSNTRRTSNFYRDYNLSGYTTAQLSFWANVSTLTGGTDYARVEYSTDGGTNWTQLRNVTAASPWAQYTYALPVGGTVRVRFSGSFNRNNTEYANWDDITVLGITSSTSTTALPANSTSQVSCQDNPNGTECHVVTDVRTLHSGTASACASCHNAAGPTNNCQTAGCHTPQFINNVDHDTNRHQTSQISTAAGQVFAGTGLDSTTCTGCHDDGIDDEHKVLAAYANTPCSICHRKTSNSGVPTNVTTASAGAAIAMAAGSALCTDCHKTVSSTSVHVQRQGTTATPGSTQFDTTWSGHKVYSTGLGSGTSFANIQGATRTWSLPTTTWLTTGWTSTSQVTCSQCHGSVTGASGPHGAAMAVKIAAGYDNSYSAGTLTLNNGSMSNTTNLCAKCHPANLDLNGDPHGRNAHDVACISCHVKTPHAWKRPRLIGYTTDPVPYRSTQVNSIRAKSYDPNAGNWTATDCGAGCATGTHPQITGTSLWP